VIAVEATGALRAELSTARHLSADSEAMETHFGVVTLVPLPALRYVSCYAAYTHRHRMHGMLLGRRTFTERRVYVKVRGIRVQEAVGRKIDCSVFIVDVKQLHYSIIELQLQYSPVQYTSVSFRGKVEDVIRV
jgi:hypothetical protein